MGPVLFGSVAVSGTIETVLVYGGLLLAATNLPASLIIGELFLLEYDALFFFKTTVGGSSVWLFSPWSLFIVLYILLALFLYWACVRRVRRIADA